MTARPPIPPKDLPPGLRQRRRADGAWRVWWEPSKTVRALGFAPVELPASAPTKALREAERLNREVARARAAGQHVAVTSIDKFPRMTDYVVPSGVRIGDADRVATQIRTHIRPTTLRPEMRS